MDYPDRLKEKIKKKKNAYKVDSKKNIISLSHGKEMPLKYHYRFEKDTLILSLGKSIKKFLRSE